ncbi:MAG TPA: hypothetical protein VMY06_02705 [Sedimentisphaerales bacterium]|nr:hypothetical protein [Sedimentisphaerales bacterium]
MNTFKTELSLLGVRITLFVSYILYGIRNAIYDTRFTILLLLPVLLSASGCQFYTVAAPMAEYYYRNPNKDLSTVGRTALVELENNSSYPQISADVTESLFQALQKKQLFGLAVIRRSDPAWRSLQLGLNSVPQTQSTAAAGSSAYTLDQLVAFHKTLKCDAILLGTITQFKPYPHMAIGLRLKLVDLRDGQLLWAFEQIWDTADKTTELRIKSYFQYQIRSGFEPLREQLVAVSPIEFIKFVVYEVAATL